MEPLRSVFFAAYAEKKSVILPRQIYAIISKTVGISEAPGAKQFKSYQNASNNCSEVPSKKEENIGLSSQLQRTKKKKCRDRWRRTRIGGEGKKQKEAQTGKECKIEVKGAIVRNRGRYRKKIATAELTTQCAVGKGSIDLLCPV